MAIRLKQSTASQEIPLGYFVDSTDGNTEETALTIANTDIKLWKAGATTLANKNSGGATHISNGLYYCVLDATDTNTLGALVVFVHVSGALPVRVECEVLAANVYDSLIAAADNLQVDAVQWAGAATATDDVALSAASAVASQTDLTTVLSRIGTPSDLGGGATLAANLSDIESQTDDIGAAGAGLTALGDTRLANLDATMSSRSTYAGGDTSGTTTLLSRLTATRAGNLDNIDATMSSRLASASYTAPDNATIAAIEADTTDIQSRLPAALIGGRMSSQVGAMGADVWDSGAVATSGANEIRDAIGNASDASYTTPDTLGNTLRLLKSGATGLVPFTVGTSSTTTAVTTNLTEATNDHYNGRTVVFLSGALAGQAASITDYVGSTHVLTVSALTETPASSDTAVIV